MLNCVFPGFNQVVQDSKGKADDALTRVPEIEALIEEAESRTQEASDALSGAEKDANDALRIAEQAESNAQDASEVSSIYDLPSAVNHCKQFGPRSGPTQRRSCPGSELFDTLMVFLK